MEDRLARLRQGLEELECDTFFSVSGPSNQYLTGFLTGFEEVSAAVVVQDGQAVFLTDSRYTEQAAEEVSGFEIGEIKGDLLEKAGNRLGELGAKRVLFDPTGITVDEMTRLTSAFSGTLVPNKGLLTKMRQIKSAEEVEAIRAASQLAESVLEDLTATLEAGISERELAAQFEYEFKKRGAMGAAFDTIALFGARSSLPHGVPGDRRLAVGDIVLLDLGCRHRGYCSDLTRTYVFGTVGEAWVEEVYNLVLAAQRNALKAVRAGVACTVVDAAARDLISEGGYGDDFRHSTGHGVGIEVHEVPRLSAESDAVLEAGMAVTVEPGIYLPGKGGIRIEDLVVVTEAGCDVLTSTPKEFKVLSK